ncbi:MAG: GAF domain-containing sensor histidine kinase, partial [Proteobacteria bacterium]|nr:GAF domain-containing sensor histidine kinase [Pseudomonadota bacterium]
MSEAKSRFDILSQENPSDKVSLLRQSVDKFARASFLCEVDQENIYNLKIIHCNQKFLDNFGFDKKRVLGNSYDFIFQKIDIDYNSDNQEQYSKLLRAVKNFQSVSVDIDIVDLDDDSKSDNYRVTFSPSDFNDEDLYCFFTFEKLAKVKGSSTTSSKPTALIKNLERTLRNERTLRKVSDIIVSDTSISDIARSVAEILCKYFKVDRCILHDYNEGKTGFLIEYCDNFSKPMIPVDKKMSEEDLSIITRYINIQNQVLGDIMQPHERHNVTLASSEIMNDDRFRKIEDICSKFSISSQIAMVTTFDGKINGGIYLHQSSPRRWLMEEIELMEMIAEQFSIAIDRSYAIDKVMIANHQLLEKTLQLKKSLKEEKKIRKMQNEFVAMVSHEFKTPLQIIDSARELLVRKLRKIELPEESGIEKNLDKIKSGISRLNGLIQSTFNLSKIETDKNMVTADKKDFDIKLLIRELLEKNSSLAVDKNLQIESDLSKLPDLYNGDSKLLDHCFTNIITNAMKYSNKDSSIKILGDVKGSNIEIKVTD